MGTTDSKRRSITEINREIAALDREIMEIDREIDEIDRKIAAIEKSVEDSVREAAIKEYNIKGFLICGDVYTYVNEDDKLKNPIIGEATVTIEDGLKSIIKEFRFEMNTDDNRTKITETVDTY